MSFDFDTPTVRLGTASYKWDGAKAEFHADDVLPLWVADMDFRCAPAISDALHARVDHGIYGYTIRTSAYYNALCGWFARRDRWNINPDQLAFSPPGVIFGMAILIDLLTKPGDGVVMQTPNYDSLMDLVTKGGRRLYLNPMRKNSEKYELDLNQLDALLQKGNIRLLLMTNPNNPTGRLWTQHELSAMAALCLRYGVTMISDDIHSDIRPAGSTYIPLVTLSDEVAQHAVVCTSTNKTFNLGGLGMGTFIIPNRALRQAYEEKMKQYQTRLDNVFSTAALIAAYTKCDEWVNAMNNQICQNRALFESLLHEQLPQAISYPMDATYFAWIDLNKLGKGPALQDFLLHKCRVAFTPGSDFSTDSASFVRVNLACPHSILSEAVRRISVHL